MMPSCPGAFTCGGTVLAFDFLRSRAMVLASAPTHRRRPPHHHPADPMSPRRSSRPLTRPSTTPPADRIFQSSLSGWYAAWKARRNSTAAGPAATADAGPAGDEDRAVADWLTAATGDPLSRGPA